MRVLFRRIQGKWTRIHRREKGFIKHAAATALIFWMLWLIIAPLIFIVLHHIRAFLSQYISMPTLNWASLGQMGDMFGGLNTLLNFFVLTGVVYASIVQTRQLRDARAALRNQKASSSIEAFDQSFFSLLSLNRETTDRLKLNLIEYHEACNNENKKLERLFHGTQVLEQFGLQLLTALNSSKFEGVNRAFDVVNEFDKIYKAEAYQLGPYFRSLYHLLKHIHNAPYAVSNKERIRYAKLVRAQMGERSVFLFAINSQQGRGVNAKKYVEMFGLLEHMDETYKNKAKESLIAGGFSEESFTNPTPDRLLKSYATS